MAIIFFSPSALKLYSQQRSCQGEGRRKHRLATPTSWALLSPERGLVERAVKFLKIIREQLKNYLQGNEGEQREHEAASDEQADYCGLHATPGIK